MLFTHRSPGRPPARPLHTITLAALMRHPSAPDRYTTQFEEKVKNGWRHLEYEIKDCGLADKKRPFEVPGYEIAFHTYGLTGVVAVFEEATGKAIGGLAGGDLWVHPEHRRKGIGSEIMITAFEQGIIYPDSGRILSDAGRQNRRLAHRKAVQRAVENGIAVDPEVLADYPDLQTTLTLA